MELVIFSCCFEQCPKALSLKVGYTVTDARIQRKKGKFSTFSANVHLSQTQDMHKNLGHHIMKNLNEISWMKLSEILRYLTTAHSD